MAPSFDFKLTSDNLYAQFASVNNYADFTSLILKLPRDYRKYMLAISTIIRVQSQSHFGVIEKFRSLAKKVNRNRYKEYAEKCPFILDIGPQDPDLHNKLFSNYDGFSESDKSFFLNVIRFLVYYDQLYESKQKIIQKKDSDSFQEFINIMGNIEL